MREQGWYWVKETKEEDWKPAHYRLSEVCNSPNLYGEWIIDNTYPGGELYAINEERIKEPDPVVFIATTAEEKINELESMVCNYHTLYTCERERVKNITNKWWYKIFSKI